MSFIKKVKKSFSLKILLLIVSIAAVPYIVLNILTVSFVRNNISNQTQQSLQAVSTLKKEQIIKYFDKQINTVEILANTKNMFSLSKDYDNKVYNENISARFQNYIRVNKFDAMYIYNRNREVIYSTAHDISSINTDTKLLYKKPPFISYLKRNLQNNSNIDITDFYNDFIDNDSPMMYIVAPMTNDKEADNIYYLIFALSPKGINDIVVEESILGETGETFLIGDDNLMRSNSKFVKNQAILSKQVNTKGFDYRLITNPTTKDEAKYGTINDYRGVDVYSYQEPLKLSEKFNTDFDWIIIAEIDSKEALGFSNSLILFYIIFGFIVFLLIILISKYFSRLITSPIVNLTKIANKMTIGETPETIRVQSIDEIGSLTRSFRKLQVGVKKITETAISISGGNYDTRLTPRSKHDLLINSLNTMSNSLAESQDKHQELLNEVRKNNQEIEQILSCTRPIVAIGKDYKIEKVNETFCSLFNTHEDLIGKKCYEVLDLEICHSDECVMKQIMKTHTKYTKHIKTDMNNGSVSDIFITGVALKDLDDNVIGVVENISDISESVKNQKEIEERTEEVELKNWYKTGETLLLENLRGEISHHDLTKNAITFLVKYIDAQIGAIYLISESDRNILQLTSSYAFSSRNHVSNKIRPGEGLVGQAFLEKEMILLHDVPKDYITINSGLGKTPPKNIIVIPIKFENKVLGVIEIGSIKNFTQKQVSFLESIIDSLGVSINSCFAREKMQILLDMTQQQAEELQVQQEELRVANEELKEQTEELRATSEKLKIQQDELQEANISLEEKTEYLEEKKREIQIKNDEITEAKKILEIKAKQLAQASKYKSEFLANMSHELRTPLNSLLILSKDLADNNDNNLSDDQIEAATIIHNSGKDLLDLINDILDLSKVEAGKMSVDFEEVSIKDILSNIYGIYHRTAEEKGVKFTTACSPNLPSEIVTDQQRLRQIIKNLLSNSFKFTHEGSITLDVIGVDEDEFFANNDQLKDYIVIKVTDTGIGIANEKQEAIFEAFQQADGTTSRKYGGTGLGLSISKELTHLLKGEIYLESKLNEGTTFRLLLPIKPNDEVMLNEIKTRSKIKMPKIDDVETETKKKGKENSVVQAPHIDDDRKLINAENVNKVILSIEDDLTFAEILKQFCHKQELLFVHASEGKSGLKLAKEIKPRAIILDIMLPGMDGWEILSKLKKDKELESIPVQIMSANDIDEENLAFPVFGVLNKPIDKNNLINFFQNVTKDNNQTSSHILVIGEKNSLNNELSELGDLNNLHVEYTDKLSALLDEKIIDACNFILINIDNKVNSFEELDKILTKTKDDIPSIIVFCDNDNIPSVKFDLNTKIKSIIVKGGKSSERVIDEINNISKIKKEDTTNNSIPTVSMKTDKDKPLKGKKILVVDDDIRNIFAVSHVLESRDMNVNTAVNGQKALDILDQEDDFDIVLMDIMMPVMDGEEATKKIRQINKFKNLPIIVLTAKAMKGDKERFLNAGASDYLAKPLDVDKLLSTLRVWLS